MGDFDDGRVGTPPLHLSQHGLQQSKRGTDGDLWQRGTATSQCGRAPRTRQCDPGNSWDGIGMLEGVSSKQLWQGSKHSRSACSLLVAFAKK